MVSYTLVAATLHLALSLAAKLFMSFGVHAKKPEGGYEDLEKDRIENISKAQLNVAEYEATFIALFLFLHVQKVEGVIVMILCVWTVLAQAIYFWGRTISGKVMPWTIIGALSRYLCMMLFVYVLVAEVMKS
mmetsp:Transcript_3788/g.10070  ORF Transcript_3788/g.10070 Transcript_3788/m.10070 type:complete len:132 (+) Transcript_3788:101-496(+)